MTNDHSSLEFSAITFNLPFLLFNIMPPGVMAILTKWNSIDTGPQLKVSTI